MYLFDLINLCTCFFSSEMGGAPSYISTERGYRSILGIVFINYFSDKMESPQTALCYLQQLLRTLPSNMVLVLLEDKLSALTLIEYALDYIRFTSIEPSDFPRIDFETITQIHEDIALVVNMLRPTPFYDEEQSRRVEAAYQDIFSAMKQSARLQTDEAAPADAVRLDRVRAAVRRRRRRKVRRKIGLVGSD